jgi:hypothetical protein
VKTRRRPARESVVRDWGGRADREHRFGYQKSVSILNARREETMDAFAMFKPFMIDNEYLYRSDNVRALTR